VALFEDVLKTGNIATGLAVGLGMAVLAPVILPILRPVAKSVVKAGLIAYDEGRAALADVAQQAEGVVSEARAEMESRNGQSEAEPQDSSSTATGKRQRRS
jgi:hypothetical protein